jgi:hypothetical protein
MNKRKVWENVGKGKKRDLKSPDHRGHVGSIPTSGTNNNDLGLEPVKGSDPFLFEKSIEGLPPGFNCILLPFKK